MSLIEPVVRRKSRTDPFDDGISCGLLCVTITDVSNALRGGFLACEIEYMLDLPRGRIAGSSGVDVFT